MYRTIRLFSWSRIWDSRAKILKSFDQNEEDSFGEGITCS